MIAAADALSRAAAYPFGIPTGSYVLNGGQVREMVDTEVPGDRVVVLAFGANASPTALAAKLGEVVVEARVSVVAGELHDFDVVYSAHVSPYGAIPGALQHSAGAVAAVHAIHLLPVELEQVHRSEPNYEFARLDGIELRLEDGRRLESVHAYVSRHGCLRRGGGHVGVAAIPVWGRRWPVLDAEGMLAAARDDLAPGEELGDFVLAHVADPELAARRTSALRETAAPFGWPHVERIGR